MRDLQARTLILFFSALLAAYGCDCGGGSGGNGGDGDAGDGDAGDGGDGDASDRGDASLPPGADVHVVITADNAYGFGYGRQSQLTHYFMGVEDGGDDIFVCSHACDEETACPDVEGEPVECDPFGTCNDDRRGPETYIVPADQVAADDYLYVVTWSDEQVTQGLIGQFAASDGSRTIYTGQSPEWRVCATGENYDPGSGGPSAATIDEYIAECNRGSEGETFNKSWVGTTPNAENQALVVLNPASEGSYSSFAALCGRDEAESGRGDAIHAPARGIWFDDDVTDGIDAFTSVNDDPRGDFLIFRLPLIVFAGPG